MPSPRAVLNDIVELGLDHKKPYVAVSASGKLKGVAAAVTLTTSPETEIVELKEEHTKEQHVTEDDLTSFDSSNEEKSMDAVVETTDEPVSKKKGKKLKFS